MAEKAKREGPDWAGAAIEDFVMTRITSLAVATLAVGWALLCVSAPCGAQVPKPAEFAMKIGELSKEQKWDEAIALVKAKGAENPKSLEVHNVMYGLARSLSYNDRYDDALQLQQLIIERFPTGGLTTFAWCGLAHVYGHRRENEQMIAALERAFAVAVAANEPNIRSSNPHHDFAHETLATHYLQTQQWEKGLKILTGWRPSSGCGTCDAEMVTSRERSILLCLVRLGRFDEVVARAWHDVAQGSKGGNRLGPFVLVRLYSESEQLDVLGRLNATLVSIAASQFAPEGKNPKNYGRLQSTVNASAALSQAIALSRSKDWDQHFDAIVSGQRAATLDDHVAHWILSRDHKDSVHSIARGVRVHSAKGSQLIELLGLINSDGARDALVRIAAEENVYAQQYVCGVIRYRMSDPNPLIDRIAARVPADRAHQTHWHVGKEPARFQFYKPWTAPERSSLPSELPPDLFAEDKR